MHHCLSITGLMSVCSKMIPQHRLPPFKVATPMISHHLKQEFELFLILGDEFVELLHKVYTYFCIVDGDKQLVYNWSTLPVIISRPMCHGLQLGKSQPMCRRLRRSRVFGVTESFNLYNAKVAWRERAINILMSELVKCHLFSKEDNQENAYHGRSHFQIDVQGDSPAKCTEKHLVNRKDGQGSYEEFAKERIHGEKNLWDLISKVKLLTWNSPAKVIKMKSGSLVITLKATSSLFARMLLVAR